MHIAYTSSKKLIPDQYSSSNNKIDVNQFSALFSKLLPVYSIMNKYLYIYIFMSDVMSYILGSIAIYNLKVKQTIKICITLLLKTIFCTHGPPNILVKLLFA